MGAKKEVESTSGSGEGQFRGANGGKLYERWWLPDGAVKGHVLLVHGLAEHVSRYEHVAAALNGAGHGLHGYDQRGHGRSEGKRAPIRSFDEYLDDLDIFLERVRERVGDAPLFLMGHSMGGTVVTFHALTRDPQVRGVILSAPGLAVDASALLKAVGRTLSRILPDAPVQKLPASAVSRDPAVVRTYEMDPLVHHGAIRARLAASMLDVIDRIDGSMEDFRFPLLAMHGSADALTEPRGTKALVERACSEDKTFLSYDGLFHEILNEPEQDRVLADLIGWLDARSGAA